MTEFLIVDADERAPQRLRRKALDLSDQVIAKLDGPQDSKSIHDARRARSHRSSAAEREKRDFSATRDASSPRRVTRKRRSKRSIACESASHPNGSRGSSERFGRR
jgi:hypothetical protein